MPGYDESSVNRKRTIWLAALLLAICVAYANSFQNGFHFDDFHTVTDNPAVRSLKNVPRFFTDTTTFSVLPANRTYRPIVSTSLAIDYALGRGYVPLWFHLGTFDLFLGQVLLLFALYRLLLNRIRPSPANEWLAMFGAAWFGLHPAMAETIDYVIQRGDLYCTLGCTAALYLFARYPERRKTGLYLLPFAFAMLSKPPAAVFPVLLILYVYFFEQPEAEPVKRWLSGLKAALPALPATAALLWLQSTMTPKSFTPSILNAWDYRLTQPYVWTRYAAELFLPLHLNADTDLSPFSSFNLQELAGFVFLAALLAAIWITARRRLLYPIAFGLLWFVITQLPTSLYLLSEVENDHRMFFSFAGLILAVVWAVWLLLEKALGSDERTKLQPALVTAAVLLLMGYGYGVHVRNAVWHDEESLWLDDVEKSPHNGRGLMNYGLTQMNKGAYPEALDYFTRALEFTPNYATLEINLGIVNGAMADRGNGDASHTADAERHFQRAIAVAPSDDTTHSFYGRWLMQHGRYAEAIEQLQMAIALDPPRPFQHEVLIETYTREGDLDAARQAAQDTLTMVPDDGPALMALQHPPTQDEAFWINESLRLDQGGKYDESIAAARRALKLNPNSALAWNNIAAADEALHRWDDAIAAAQKAVALQPDFQLAKNNLAWSLSQKKLGTH